MRAARLETENRGMRILVTGGTGFIGRILCERLVARGDTVIALARSKKSPLPKGVERLEGDLNYFADPARVLPEVDVVIHLAAVIAADTLEQYEEINYGAVKHLVECVARQKWKPARFLFASSLAAAGPCDHGGEVNERSPLRPIDPYGDAKARAEELVRAAPFPTTTFRPCIVLGPGDAQSLTLFKAASSGVGFRVAGTPQELSFIDVRDLVEAIVLMADDRRTGSYCYFAAHPNKTNVRELWSELGRAVGRGVAVVPIPRWGLFLAMKIATAVSALFRFKNQLDAKQYAQMVAPAFVCTSAALRSDLGWRPRYTLADCLSNATEGYRAAGAIRAA
jgi:nucleoside-diphosphate-sugar epimerase